MRNRQLLRKGRRGKHRALIAQNELPQELPYLRIGAGKIDMTAPDPIVAQLLQNNPQAQQMQAAMQAHINEHLGFEYRKQIEQTMGMPLPPEPQEGDEAAPMPPQMAAQVAQAVARASQQLLQQNQQQAQAQQNAQQAADPIIQMQQQELAIKQQDAQRKAAKDAAAAAKNTNLAKFLNNLESRIYATISQNIAAELFKDGGATSGAFDIGGNHLQWVSDGSSITLTITDAGGSTTQVVVPYGSLAW